LARRVSLKINLTNSGYESVSTRVTPNRRGVFHLIPNPDESYELGSSVVTLQFSADGEHFFDHTTTLNNSSPGTQTAVVLDGVYAVRFKTTTADGAADPNALVKVYLS
jgi:hypothetical protein